MEKLGQYARPFDMAKQRVQTRFKKPKGLPNLAGWRKYRNEMTQEALAERIGKSKGFISQLEGGTSGFSQDTLEALAEALQCRPGDLINVDPSKEEAIWSLWEAATPAERSQIVAYGEGLTKKAVGRP